MGGMGQIISAIALFRLNPGSIYKISVKWNPASYQPPTRLDNQRSRIGAQSQLTVWRHRSVLLVLFDHFPFEARLMSQKTHLLVYTFDLTDFRSRVG